MNHMLRFAILFFAWLGVGFAATLAQAEDPQQAARRKGLELFEKKIRPVLVKQCYSCHAKDAKEIGGKLLLDTSEGMTRGGESGPVVKIESPAESLLIQALKYEDIQMPPEAPVSEAVVHDFIEWIKLGAPDPRNEGKKPPPPKVVKETKLWSFQPIVDPPIPAVQQPDWVADPIDAFILAKIETANLQPAEAAPPNVLARRLYHDLIGLAPRFEQLQAFEAAYSSHPQTATENLVDELLASQEFGVRWGRHWLDVARFGESNGNDGLGRNATFPHAWRYRDYVIEAFNNDLPYDRFITEQIAGDLLPADSPADSDRQIIATGFLAIGAKPAKAMNNNFEMDVVDDQINVVSSGVMGLSVSCARCHDHKHDPIPTSDYYALAGIFKSTETLYGAGAYEKLTAPTTPLHVLKASTFTEPSEEDIAFQKAALKKDQKQTLPLDKPLAMGVRDRAKPAHCKININGDSKKLGPVSTRGFLSRFNVQGEAIAIPPQASGRRELAQWLTRGDHPLTARVMVNRIWQHLFGRGIVSTPNDFGVYGDRPSHPELLDHLATRFMNEGWSTKRMIRAIVLSQTYRQHSQAEEATVTADPTNKLVARQTIRRLDAETLRDRIMQAAGSLDLQPGQGSAVQHFDLLLNDQGNLHKPSNHRSVYLCYLRNSPPSELAAFDLPDGLSVVGKRNESTLPTQSLFLINNEFVVEQSKLAASSLLNHDQDTGQRIAELWRRTLQRHPNEKEVAGAKKLIDSMKSDQASDETAWATLCQALFAINEFRYVD